MTAKVVFSPKISPWSKSTPCGSSTISVCPLSSFFHSLHHAGGSFSKRQSAPPLLFRPGELSSHTPGRHSSPFCSLFFPSFTSFPASQSPGLQVAPLLASPPPFFCQLLPSRSTPLKVSAYVRPPPPLHRRFQLSDVRQKPSE